MKRFLGIFATALLFLFLFTFFGGSIFWTSSTTFMRGCSRSALASPPSSGRSGGWTTK